MYSTKELTKKTWSDLRGFSNKLSRLFMCVLLERSWPLFCEELSQPEATCILLGWCKTKRLQPGQDAPSAERIAGFAFRIAHRQVASRAPAMGLAEVLQEDQKL